MTIRSWSAGSRPDRTPVTGRWTGEMPRREPGATLLKGVPECGGDWLAAGQNGAGRKTLTLSRRTILSTRKSSSAACNVWRNRCEASRSHRSWREWEPSAGPARRGRSSLREEQPGSGLSVDCVPTADRADGGPLSSTNAVQVAGFSRESGSSRPLGVFREFGVDAGLWAYALRPHLPADGSHRIRERHPDLSKHTLTSNSSSIRGYARSAPTRSLPRPRQRAAG